MRNPQTMLTSLLRIAVLVVILSISCVVSAPAQELIRIGGTGGALAVMKKLASEFQRDHPGIATKILPSLGSSGGIKAVLSGALDIGVSAKPLKDAEQGANAWKFGRTPFVFAVLKNNPVSGFTLKELEAIYSGRTGSWPDGRRIRVVLRPQTESDTWVLKSMSQDMNRAVTEALLHRGMIVALTDQDNADAIETIPGALGTITLGQLICEERPFKVLSVDGVRPALDTFAGEPYTYFKMYYLVTKPDERPAVREFRNFVFSARGKEILSRCGYQVVR